VCKSLFHCLFGICLFVRTCFCLQCVVTTSIELSFHVSSNMEVRGSSRESVAKETCESCFASRLENALAASAGHKHSDVWEHAIHEITTPYFSFFFRKRRFVSCICYTAGVVNPVQT
jgi:hypothetical protein